MSTMLQGVSPTDRRQLLVLAMIFWAIAVLVLASWFMGGAGSTARRDEGREDAGAITSRQAPPATGAPWWRTGILLKGVRA